MSTQYNNIQGPYDYMRTQSIALIESENVQDTLKPFIRDAKVLELACGSGHYTYDFLKWGAKSVVGVDISSVMIEEARRRGKALGDPAKSVDFILSDCGKPTSYKGGPFDVVFGAWLLNYAPDHAALVEMFRNIALNLKDGGHFVGVTLPGAQDPLAFLESEKKLRPPPLGSGLLYYNFINRVEDGIFFNAHADTQVGVVDFDCYHLRKDIYDSAAKEGGLQSIHWDITRVPERYLKGEGSGGASLEELKSYREVPNYGVVTVIK